MALQNSRRTADAQPLPSGSGPAARGRMRSKPFAPESLFGIFIGLMLVGSLVVQTMGIQETMSGAIWRLGIVLLMIACMAMSPNRQDMVRFTVIFSPWLAVTAISLLAHRDLASIADLLKQAFIVGLGALVFGSSYNHPIRRMCFWTLITCAMLALAASLVETLPVLSHGWSFKAARELKAQSYQAGFGSNAICFAGLVAVLGCFRDELMNRRVLIATAVLLAISSFFLTARAPVAALILAAGGAWALATWRPRELFDRSLLRTWMFAAGSWALVLAAFLSQIQNIAHSKAAEALAGRAALWQIAMASFWQNPLFGTGVRTYTDVIRSNLSQAHMTIYWERTALYSLQGGGVHNTWLNILTERGAVGFLGLFLSYTLLFAAAIYAGGKVPFQRRLIVLIALLFMLLRGMFEISGLFSYAEGALDAVVMITVALSLPRLDEALPLKTGPAANRRSRSGQGAGDRSRPSGAPKVGAP